MKKLLIPTILAFLLPLFLFSQSPEDCCDIEATDFPDETGQSTNTQNRVGQSFIPCGTGDRELRSITIYTNDLHSSTDINGQVILLEGEATSSPSEVSQDILIPGGEGTHTLILPEPYPLTPGQTYSWLLQGPAEAIHIISNGMDFYPNGQALQGGQDLSTTAPIDLFFELEICARTPGDDDDPEDQDEVIPTLGEWGLIMLSLSLLIIGVVAIRAAQFKTAAK